MAHPVRPDSYVEINNFYTATVYEKGAEVVRMMQTLVGRDGFAKGLSLYFERYDGQAVTCDDFRQAMADANGKDLDQFANWYGQAGTPTVTVWTRPIRPLRTNSAARCTPGVERSSLSTRNTRLSFAAIALSWRPSAIVRVIGFSSETSLPASKAATAIGACQ